MNRPDPLAYPTTQNGECDFVLEGGDSLQVKPLHDLAPFRVLQRRLFLIEVTSLI